MQPYLPHTNIMKTTKRLTKKCEAAVSDLLRLASAQHAAGLHEKAEESRENARRLLTQFGVNAGAIATRIP